MGHFLAVGHEAQKFSAIPFVEYSLGDLSDLCRAKVEGYNFLVVSHGGPKLF